MSARDMVGRRSDYDETFDDFPTPPWATRALMERVLPRVEYSNFKDLHVLEPACGRGYMSNAIKEYGCAVTSTDVRDYGYPDQHVLDYLSAPSITPHWVITNPPYAKLLPFIEKALSEATHGVAMLTRIQALMDGSRYRRLYSTNPPTIVAFFSGRLKVKQGRVVQNAPAMFHHCWLVWKKGMDPLPPTWIEPKAQEQLEKPEDYL